MILSLAMLKMEKNFIAVIDKGYQRTPYLDWPISNKDNKGNSLIGFVEREIDELKLEIRTLEAHKRTKEKGIDFVDNRMIIEQIYNSMLEVADVSNTLDYLFEGLLEEYHSLEKNLK